MKKLMTLIAVLALFAGAASAATHVYTNAFGQVVTVTDGIASVAVDAGTADTAVYGAYYSQTVTNGQTVAIVPDTVNVLTSTGQADGKTNTIALAAFAASSVGKVIWVANAKASTNAVAIAQSGVYDGPAFTLAAGQGSFLIIGGMTNHVYGN